MKTLKVTLDIPLPDEATVRDAEGLVELISRRALTGDPSAVLSEWKAYGRLGGWVIEPGWVVEHGDS